MVSKPGKFLASASPAGGVSPTRSPGGKIASAANVGRNAAASRTAAVIVRRSFMKNLFEVDRPFNGQPARPHVCLTGAPVGRLAFSRFNPSEIGRHSVPERAV